MVLGGFDRDVSAIRRSVRLGLVDVDSFHVLLLPHSPAGGRWMRFSPLSRFSHFALDFGSE
jgi:hypothetical protein